MGLLDGGLQSIFGAAFGGHFLAGTLYRVGAAQTRDGRGRAVPGTPTTDRIKGQVDGVTEAMRTAPNYTAEDARLIVLQVGPDGVVTKPSTDDQVTLGGTRWAVDMVASDPANTYWEMRGTPA